MDALSYQDLHHGRLLHVRCHFKDHCIDLVNLYQFPVGPTVNRPHPLKLRQELWTKLTSLLRRIPARHTLVIGGDFNTTVGHGLQPGFPDASCLQDILEEFQLSNTRKHDSTPSYCGPRGSSTIDFLLMRKVQSDAASKHTRCPSTCPLVQARAYPDHRPLVGSFPADWKIWYQANKRQSIAPSMSKHSKNFIRASQDQTSEWTAFVGQATGLIQDASHPTELVNKILKCSQAVTSITQSPLPLWMQHETRSLVARKWRHLHWARTQRPDLQGILRAWSH